MGAFTVYPAIDLANGQVVRLRQGRREEGTRYPTTPAEAAAGFRDAGAQWLHVVDLDGAFDARVQNRRALEEILSVGLPVQFGGGLRDLQAVGAALELGVNRVILGTLALRQPETLGEALARHGSQRVLVAIDARGSALQTHGWTQDHPSSVMEYARRLADMGVGLAIYTAADRDGTGRGLDVETAAELQASAGLEVIVAGGAGSTEDIQRAKEAGLAGAVLGKALHDGRLSLQEVLGC